MKTIYIASDHAGFNLKEKIVKHLDTLGFSVVDMGATTYQESDDYPDLIVPLAQKISSLAKEGQNPVGIILGGSGQGEAIVANRFSHVRAGVYNTNNTKLITLLRQHNDANVLSLGARFLSEVEALDAVEIFINTPFSHDPRHERRIKEIDVEC